MDNSYSYLVNYDTVVKNKRLPKNENKKTIQNCSRSLVYGMSGSGKTNTVLNLLFNPKTAMTYDRVYLYTKDPEEDKYKWMKEQYEKIENKIKKKHGIDYKMFFCESDLDKVVPLDEIDKDFSNIVIFDDMITDASHPIILDYWIRSRKYNCSCFFITQSFYTVPKDIRINTDYLVMFKVNNKGELDRIYNECVHGVDKETFKGVYNDAIDADPNNFILVDNKTTEQNRKVRKGIL